MERAYPSYWLRKTSKKEKTLLLNIDLTILSSRERIIESNISKGSNSGKKDLITVKLSPATSLEYSIQVRGEILDMI